MAKKQTLSPEWSHKIDADEIGSEPQSYFLNANEEERANIARRLDIEGLEELTAKINLSRDPGGLRIYADGHLKAKVVQKCVITSDPIEGWLEEGFEAWFADEDQTVSFVKARKDRDTKRGHQEVKMVDEDEDPEPIIDGFIDAGELVVQYLSLAINPYPHAEGAHYEYGDDDEQDREPSQVRKNPFEALKNWKESR